MPSSKAHRLRSWLLLLTAILVLQPGLALSGDTSFSGTLERVGSGSISIRLADRRIIDALLSNRAPLDSTTVLAKYGLGDTLEVACEPIQPVWEEGTSKYQSLEVTGIRLIRRPSSEELSRILEAAPFREGKNLLKRPEAQTQLTQTADPADLGAAGAAELAHARPVNLRYAGNMPNFVADEKAKRYRIGPGSSTWRDFDTVESEITFKGNHVARQRIRRDGKPWDQPFEALPGFKWYEGFGTEITPLFDPRCPTKLEYQGRSKSSGRQLLDYRFSTPIDGCFPYFFFDYQRFNPARTGHVFIDDPAGNIIQLDEEATGFPKEIQFAERQEHISWDYVRIGEDSHLLPVRANFLVRYYDGTHYRIEIEYKNHRHFEASSNVTFAK
jgi:hypothetical protein